MTEWEEFNGQSISVGDWLWHKQRGLLQVILSTKMGTLKAITKSDNPESNGITIDLTHYKGNVTHYANGLAD